MKRISFHLQRAYRSYNSYIHHSSTNMSAVKLQQIQEDPDRKDVFGVLNKCIQPDSATPVSKAAASFAQDVKAQDEKFFWGFWNDVFSVAEQIPHDNPAQDKLAVFVRELTLTPETGDTVWEVSFLSFPFYLSLSLNRGIYKKQYTQLTPNPQGSRLDGPTPPRGQHTRAPRPQIRNPGESLIPRIRGASSARRDLSGLRNHSDLDAARRARTATTRHQIGKRRR